MPEKGSLCNLQMQQLNFSRGVNEKNKAENSALK
jgi:hypothetical protein